MTELLKKPIVTLYDKGRSEEKVYISCTANPEEKTKEIAEGFVDVHKALCSRICCSLRSWASECFVYLSQTDQKVPCLKTREISENWWIERSSV